jgi:hypothetical protein
MSGSGETVADSVQDRRVHVAGYDLLEQVYSAYADSGNVYWKAVGHRVAPLSVPHTHTHTHTHSFVLVTLKQLN